MYVNYFLQASHAKPGKVSVCAQFFLMLTLKNFYFVYTHAHDFSTPVQSFSF